MRSVIAALVLLFSSPLAKAQPFDYFCIFTNQAAAQVDAVVGTYWIVGNSAWDLSQTFPGVTVSTPSALVDGISAITGFWIVVSSPVDNAALDAKANCVMKLDRQAAILGNAFVVASTGLSGTGRTSFTFQPVPHGSRYPRPLGQ
jgi:hypothetical protein